MYSAKNALTHKVLATSIAIALVSSLSMSAQLAYADSVPSSSQRILSSKVALDATGVNAGANADTNSGDNANAGGSEAANANANVVSGLPAANVVVVDSGSAHPDVIQQSVSISSGAQPAVLVQDGLTYKVVDEELRTVALCGWSGAAPKGELTIPAQVGNPNNPYLVSRVDLCGGGSVQNWGVENSQNPQKISTAAAVTDNSESGEGSGAEITSDADFAGEIAPDVTSITIPATVEEIDLAFFQMFPNVAEISVADGNKNFNSYNGMLFNSDLTSLLLVPEDMEGVAVLPMSLASVPACVFSRCTKLMAISFPGSTGNDSFICQDGILYTQDKYTLLAAPAGLGASATIAAECGAIADGAFLGNTNLHTIVVNGNVESISSTAFSAETIDAATVVLPSGVSRSAWEAVGFSNFAEPAQAGQNSSPQEGSGFEFTLLPDYTLSVSWSGAGASGAGASGGDGVSGASDAADAAADTAVPDADLRIPDFGRVNGVDYSVSQIAESGFAGFANIMTVELPATITHIGAGAFDGCAGLQGITFPSSLQSIGDCALRNTALMSAVLPKSLQQVGKDAFAGLHGTTIVATGMVAEVDSGALGNSAGVTVYVPVGSQPSAWNAGVAELNNTVNEYGLKFSVAATQLQAGDVVDLFGDEGYLFAPPGVQVTYAYKADSVSVDTASGVLTAKKPGPFTVDVSLSIKVNEAVAGSRAERIVELSPASFGGAPKQASAAQRVQRNIADSYSLKGYVSNADERAIPVISVTIPVRVEFGGSGGYDISNGQPASLTADAYFTNNGAPVAISSIKTATDANSQLTSLVQSSDEAGNPLASQKLFTLSGVGSDVQLGYNDTFANAASLRTLASGERLDCTYILNLSAAELLLDPDKADGSFRPLTTVTYTFTAVADADLAAAATAAGDAQTEPQAQARVEEDGSSGGS